MVKCHNVRICLVNTVLVLTNSVDPDQTPRSAASDQGLHCLPPTEQFWIHH